MAEATEFDFTALKVEKAELPPPAGGRTKQIKHNPFTQWVGDSYSDGTGRAVTVPKSQVKLTERLIRDAATSLGIGVRVNTEPKGEALEKAAQNKNVRVQFQGKEKKKYSPRKSKTETQPETPEAPVAE